MTAFNSSLPARRPVNATTGLELTPDDIANLRIKFLVEMGSSYQQDDEYFASFSKKGEVFDLDEYTANDMREMLRKDGAARAVQSVLTGPIRAASWSLVAGKGDSGEADWANEFFNRPSAQGGMLVPMTTLIAQALSSRTFKKAFFEKVWAQDKDGKIIYKKIAFRPAGTCGVRRDPKTGTMLGYKQRPIRQGIYLTDDQDGVDIDMASAVIHINGAWIDPIKGNSDMEIPYWCHIQKMKILWLWFMFLETQANPRTVVSNSNDTAVEQDATKIAQLKGGGVVGIPNKVELHMLESNGQAAGEFEAAINWLDRTMAESVLAGFLNLTGAASAGTRGSQALSKDQSSFFLEQENSVAAELQDTFTNQVVAPLIYLNFGPDAVVPTFEFGTIGDGDIDRIVSLITGLAAQPASPFPAAFLSKLAEKAAVYLDIDLTDIQEEMDKAKTDAETLAQINVDTAKEKLNQLQNPPPPPVPGAAGFGASLKTVADKVAKKGVPSGKPAPAKPAAVKPAAKPTGPAAK